MATEPLDRPRSADADAGVVLLTTLLLVVLLTTLGAASALLVSVETTAAANHRDRFDVANAAEGLMDFSIQELAMMSDWTPLLTGLAVSRLNGPLVLPLSAGGTALDIAALTTTVQQETFGGGGWGADTPRWRPYGRGAASTVAAIDGLGGHIFGIVWVSDDVAESDGDPATDTNGVVVIRARALGLRRSQADVQAVIARVAPGIVRRVSSRLVP